MEEKILKVNQNGMLAMLLIILSQLAAIGGMIATAMKLE